MQEASMNEEQLNAGASMSEEQLNAGVSMSKNH